ncbi:MAG: hypothetical protein OSB69_14075 [Alphaproteobacteria bacterium]|nr:hypothetical protein [Alphaproteobacteria bacterium]
MGPTAKGTALADVTGIPTLLRPGRGVAGIELFGPSGDHRDLDSLFYLGDFALRT